MRTLVGGLVIGGAACAVLCRRYYTQRRRLTVVVSASDDETQAAAIALAARAVAVSVPSQVSEQPIGLDETLRGARSRLDAMLESSEAQGADLALAIQHGVLRALGGEEETWIGIAVVVLHDIASGSQRVATSSGFQIGTDIVAEWAESGAEGKIPVNVPRAAAIEHAIELAMATMSEH